MTPCRNNKVDAFSTYAPHRLRSMLLLVRRLFPNFRAITLKPMSGFCRKAVVYNNCIILRNSSTLKLCFHVQKTPSIFISRYISSAPKEQSFVTSYLVNNCGFSPETALSASKRVRFESSERPDSFFTFLRNYGFSDSQVCQIVRKEPRLLLSSPEKILLPKFEFIQSKGVTSSELVEMVTASPQFLFRSLENHIIPTFDFVKAFLLSDDKVALSIKKCTVLISHHHVRTNIQVLVDNGVPKSSVALLLRIRPLIFQIGLRQFKDAVEDVKNMGFDPLKSTFVLALNALKGISKAKWDRKMQLYKKWNWSEETILAAFGKVPQLMLVSEDKINAVMDFFINQLGWDSARLAKRPHIFTLSLQRRVKPRISIVLFLSSKGLINKKASLITPLYASEAMFLQKYVLSFKEHVPQLLDLYQGNLNLPNKKHAMESID